MSLVQPITVGEVCARFLEALGTRAAFGVISIHNMPILDAFHRLQTVRFVSARGEAGACNMADAYARITGGVGVCVTSTGTGAGNAAGALIEAMTAGTPMLHLTGQIESPYLDRDLGYIHESPKQLAWMAAVGKAAFRIANPETALATLKEAARLAQTAPCGPVSIEIPIDVQKALASVPAAALASVAHAFWQPLPPAPVQPSAEALAALVQAVQATQRPLLWLGGGARRAGGAVARLVKLGFGVVTSVQGRGVVAEDHPASLGSYNLQKPAEQLYATCDAMLVVGSRLRSNETLTYKLKLPRLLRVDANPLADGRGYASDLFVHGDAALTLSALADALEASGYRADPALHADVAQARAACEAFVNGTLGPYQRLKDGLAQAVAARKGAFWWVRDITLSNSMWGNRAPVLNHPRAGVHALGGGIGQGLAMGIGVAVADAQHGLKRRTVVLAGDGGFMLNLGELACAVQEQARMVVLLMNDQRYGVIKNIQDDIYGSRHAYVELHTPTFSQLCASVGAKHHLLADPAQTDAVLAAALDDSFPGPVVVEVGMQAWGPFAAKFAGPILKKD